LSFLFLGFGMSTWTAAAGDSYTTADSALAVNANITIKRTSVRRDRG
jgi:hypothetical protein